MKCKCLEIISGMLPIEGASFKEPAQAMLKLISSYMNYQEPRVRSASFKALVNHLILSRANLDHSFIESSA